ARAPGAMASMGAVQLRPRRQPALHRRVRLGLGRGPRRAFHRARARGPHARRHRRARGVRAPAPLVRARLLAAQRSHGARAHDRGGAGRARLRVPPDGRAQNPRRGVDREPEIAPRDLAPRLPLRGHPAPGRILQPPLARPRRLRSAFHRPAAVLKNRAQAVFFARFPRAAVPSAKLRIVLKARSGALRDGLPLLPLTPSLIVIVGVAVAIAITLVGVRDLRRASDANSSLRAEAIATTLAARLRVTGSEDRKEVVQAAARGTYADILLLDHKGQIVADASLRPPPRAELVRCLLAGKGVADMPLLGRTRYAAQPLGPPLENLSVIAMVPAPVTPTEARGLLKAVATLTALLVGAAGIVGYVFAND